MTFDNLNELHSLICWQTGEYSLILLHFNFDLFLIELILFVTLSWILFTWLIEIWLFKIDGLKLWLWPELYTERKILIPWLWWTSTGFLSLLFSLPFCFTIWDFFYWKMILDYVPYVLTSFQDLPLLSISFSISGIFLLFCSF